MSRLTDQIRKAILGRNPLVYLLSPEEDRMIGVLREVAAGMEGGAAPVRTWSCVTGFSESDDGIDARDPVRALEVVLASDRKGFFIMKDLPSFMDQPAVIRALREVYYACRGGGDLFVFIISPELLIPDGVKKEIHLVEVASPDEAEIEAEIEAVRETYPDSQLPREYYPEAIVALKGMTLAEIDHVLHRVLQADVTDKETLLTEIFEEKERVVKQSGYLEFCPPRWGISNIGGLDNLKDWLTKRRSLFTREALAAGVPMPKGLLIMGVSGCGKSLAIKVISSLWNVPLFRLDMNLVMSGLYGTPESAFHKALTTIESVAPAVLWIDEIENCLGLAEDRVEMDSHIFSAFLTWMQEKPPMVFIGATANRIHALPAEIIRKGRFDQVFFVNLPNEAEREEIIAIHLRQNNADPAEFDLSTLSLLMEGWNGAEIEQAVISARIDAYAEDRPFNQKDVGLNVNKIVPLSKTMDDQIKAIRDWAFGRATPASKHGKRARY